MTTHIPWGSNGNPCNAKPLTSDKFETNFLVFERAKSLPTKSKRAEVESKPIAVGLLHTQLTMNIEPRAQSSEKHKSGPKSKKLKAKLHAHLVNFIEFEYCIWVWHFITSEPSDHHSSSPSPPPPPSCSKSCIRVVVAGVEQ